MSTTLKLVLILAALAVGFVIYKMITGRIERTRDEVQKILQSFLDGSEGEHGWDDFVSVRIRDSVLDSVRERVRDSDSGGDYPPSTEQGRKIIHQLLDELSTNAG